MSTRRVFLGRAAVLAAGGMVLKSADTAAALTRASTDWFKAAQWGVFCHYLAPEGLSSDDWNRQVDAFDVDGLAGQLEYAGARYFFITIGQNSGHYCSPNSAYDRYVGIQPGKCSRRDLVAEIADALTGKDIRMLVYLPSGAPANDRTAAQRLGWEWGFVGEHPAWNTGRTGKRLAEFQLRWEEIIREWSLRWGKKVSGWWLDGCYFSDEMYRNPEPPNFASFAAALKAGNPGGIVAFNPGVMTPVISLTEHEDYVAGEISTAFPVCPGRWVDGAQYHILSYLGKSWGSGDPRFVDEFVIGYTRDVVSKGGVVTWDVPIAKNGRIPQPYLEQLKKLK